MLTARTHTVAPHVNKTKITDKILRHKKTLVEKQYRDKNNIHFIHSDANVVVMALSSFGECSTVHFPPALFLKMEFS